MGLFDAKYCSICGNKLGLLGTTKLEDGYLCKDCTHKLSPYFPRRHQTVETAKQHLAYRQENAARLPHLNLTATYGDTQKIMVDEEKKLFVISRSSDVTRSNPDIFRFADVLSIAKEVKEDAEELFDKDSEGKKVSFDPPKFEYSSSFGVKMSVRNEHITDEFKVDLFSEKTSDEPHDDEYFKRNYLTNEVINLIKPGTVNDDPVPDVPADPVTAAPAAGRYVCYIRCAKCGTLIEGPAIPRFCPECADPVTLEDIGVIDTETGDILV